MLWSVSLTAKVLENDAIVLRLVENKNDVRCGCGICDGVASHCASLMAHHLAIT